ncbi:Uncharacterized protein HZ326_8781 [Fusarium oxysporum f. sp. albedinis]|nr:Uncharacterized protein HZ326_8781 [Fusarium oxysporum f. sp. albedinis]
MNNQSMRDILMHRCSHLRGVGAIHKLVTARGSVQGSNGHNAPEFCVKASTYETSSTPEFITTGRAR